MTSANLLILVLVGALVGLVLAGTLTGFYLAVVAGFVGTIVAGVALNEIMKRSGAGPDDSKIPTSCWSIRQSPRSAAAPWLTSSCASVESIHRFGSVRSRGSSRASSSRC
jgi:hypothetical protein